MVVHFVMSFVGCDAGNVLHFDEASSCGESRDCWDGSRQKAGATAAGSAIYER